MKEHEAAKQEAEKAIQREAAMFGPFCLMVMNSRAELAKALHWLGLTVEANIEISKILNAGLKELDFELLKILESVEHTLFENKMRPPTLKEVLSK